MHRFFIGLSVGLLLMVPYFSKRYVPDFNHAHDAFICNGTICRDKMSVLPVSWHRYVSLP